MLNAIFTMNFIPKVSFISQKRNRRPQLSRALRAKVVGSDFSPRSAKLFIPLGSVKSTRVIWEEEIWFVHLSICPSGILNRPSAGQKSHWIGHMLVYDTSPRCSVEVFRICWAHLVGIDQRCLSCSYPLSRKPSNTFTESVSSTFSFFIFYHWF